MASAVFDNLNNEQADGLACIVCNADYTTTGIYSVPVGISETTRSQVFACEAMCAPAVGYRPPVGDQLPLGADCAPGCVAPADGVHTSCPGPLVGSPAVSTR
jgi:hypothetical protein